MQSIEKAFAVCANGSCQTVQPQALDAYITYCKTHLVECGFATYAYIPE